MNLQRINELLKKYGEDKATISEVDELNEWYRLTAYQDVEYPGEERVGADMLKRLKMKIQPVKTSHTSFKWLVAASIILVLGITGLFVLRIAGFGKKTELEKLAVKEIVPGGNKAVLILANGKRISLSDAINEQIDSQQGVSITKTANGQLVYSFSGMKNNDVAEERSTGVFNTVETPKGGQYQISLPDGSKVWLNAYSSLKFPLHFDAGGERRVELSGEAYFEVAHNAKRPFKVVTSRQTIEVLGTHFNVNGYEDDEDTKTTLLEGSVRVSAAKMSATLIPGQQASLTDRFEVRQVNTEECVAWKNGFFKFDETRLEDIMKSISRWYDVDVVFEDQDLKKETFGALTKRFASIVPLLRMIEQTGEAHFTIRGKTIIVSRKDN